MDHAHAPADNRGMLAPTIMILVALAPFALATWFRRLALRRGASADAVWFPFALRMQWLGLLDVSLWPSVPGWLGWPLRHAIPGPFAATVWIVVPLLATQVFIAACLHDVNRRVRGAELSPFHALRVLWT